MRAMKTAALLGLGLLCCHALDAWAESEEVTHEEVRQLAEDVQRARREVSYEAEETVYAFSADRILVTRYRVRYKYPNLLRESVQGPEGERISVLEDGQYIWTYFPSRKTVVKEPLDESNRRFRAEPVKYVDLIAQNYRLLFRGTVPAEDLRCRIVEFLPKVCDRPRREVWIEEKRSLPVRVYVSSQDGRPAYRSELEKVRWNPRFKEGTFRLRVPQDTRLYEVRRRPNLSVEEARRILNRRLILPGSVPQGYLPQNIVLHTEGLRKMLQIIYTDGLSTFSVFEEWNPKGGGEAPPAPQPGIAPPAHKPAVPVPDVLPIIRQFGVLNVVTFDRAGHKTVFVGDIQRERLLEIAASLR